MKIRLEQPEREAMNGEVNDNDFGAIRNLMFEYQRYTEGTDITAVNAETGERLARLRFEWLED